MIILGSIWDKFGILLGSFWGRVRVNLGSFCDQFGIHFVVSGPSNCSRLPFTVPVLVADDGRRHLLRKVGVVGGQVEDEESVLDLAD